ncbi:MAG TPA: metallophosphoesterase [Solirubrobacteraceae bacterium]
MPFPASLMAISDLHVTHPENRRIVESLRPAAEGDWLIVGGDISEAVEDVRWALTLLRERFAKVLWVPGNHELWTTPGDPLKLRGVQRYEHLVELCRGLGVLTPEDSFPVWEGPGEPVLIAPLFVLYDYTFGRNIAPTKERSLALAHRAGVVCSDEFLLHPDPYPSRDEWCHARVKQTERRLEDDETPFNTILVNHFPLIDAPLKVLRHPEFAQWCGTECTADWHRRFRASAVVYGHLHIPRTTWHEGVRFEEVSLGYPREWHRRAAAREPLRRIWPPEEP